MTWEKQIVLAGYKALALKHHPDKGGKDDDFKSLVVSHDRLLELLAALEGPNPQGIPVPWGRPIRVQPPQSPEQRIQDILINVAEMLVNPRAKRRRR